jgi:hypothetical protein
MNLPRYPIAANDEYSYLFFSDGSKGKIVKRVIYSHIGRSLYNLGFGDWNEESRQLNDFSRTNNGDRDKVLVTVAFTALDFTSKIPDAQIFVEGSTSARTRLYQMGIGYNLLEIKIHFEVFGFLLNRWEPFEPGTNYESFLIKRK